MDNSLPRSAHRSISMFLEESSKCRHEGSCSLGRRQMASNKPILREAWGLQLPAALSLLAQGLCRMDASAVRISHLSVQGYVGEALGQQSCKCPCPAGLGELRVVLRAVVQARSQLRGCEHS